MKGYVVSCGSMGYIGDGKYMLFATEGDYEDFLKGGEEDE